MKNLKLAHIEPSGLQLIEASAGTGKTWTIAALYIVLLLEKRLRPEEILVVTYTKAATTELRDRVRIRISEALDLFSSGRAPRDELEEVLSGARGTDTDTAVKLLTRALYSFDDAAIFTIHGFCQRALLENAFESGSLFDTEMITDQSALVDEVCNDFWRTNVLGGPAEFLKQLLTAGYTPEKLAQPFKGHYQDPGLSIIPVTGEPDLTVPVAARNILIGQVASLWRSDRHVILEELAAARLNQRSYSPAQVTAAAEALKRWFDRGDPDQKCDKLEFFTCGKIASCRTAASRLPAHHFFTVCQELFDTVSQIDRAFTENLFHLQSDLFHWMKTELPRRKQARNLRCFDDLLFDLHNSLAGDNGGQLARTLRTRFKAALIDEFQDTDPLQWQIFNRFCSEAEYPLFLIGDPKQAIYSFRGADIYAYIEAARAVEEEKRTTLDTNRRSASPLVEAVNRLFSAADDPFIHKDIRFHPVHAGRDPHHGLLRHGTPVGAPLHFWVYPRENQSNAINKGDACRTIVRSVADEISRLLDGTGEIVDKSGRRRLAPGDIAVLVKAHYQADLVQEALRERSIPSVQHGSSTIFASLEALDLLRIMRAVNEPSLERLVREALLTSTMGLSANELDACLTESANDTLWDEWLQRFRKLRDAARANGVISMAELLLSECGVRGRALRQYGGERLLTNLLHCVELLHQAEKELGLALDGLIIWLERSIARNEEDETSLLRLETDADAVQLSTIHASKGLEYPVVFLPFAWDAPSGRDGQLLFHDSNGRLILDLGSDESKANRILAAEERAAEAARLLYVAVTRAEFLCYVVWGNINGAAASPLFPLLHGRSIVDQKGFKAHSDQNILDDIRKLGASAPGLAASMMPVGAPAPPYLPAQDQTVPYTCRSLHRGISSDWRVTSFSGLTAGVERSQQPHDYDALNRAVLELSAEDNAARTPGCSIYDFPRGAAAGTCLHEILQSLDFSDLSDLHISQVTRSCLQSGGYHEQWVPAVSRMVVAVTRTSLIPDSPQFCLSTLNKGSWQPELEFFLPIAQLSPDRLLQTFEGLLRRDLHGDFEDLLADLHFQQSHGMLHGFMDMVFQHDGRYFIIDWKSNHLGFSGSDYSHAGMTGSMAAHSYILQYHLYTLALDRYLRLHLPGYTYERHFGGAIYVFLRGIDNDCPGQGIYHDRPSACFIERANRLLLG